MRLGLIGCGDIGSLRAAAIAKSHGCKLVVVSDTDAVRASRVASQAGATVELDWRAVCVRPDVDAVIVSTPPNLHAPMAIEAVLAGKHVLCEKPLARTPEECRTIMDAQQKTGCFVATGFNYRFFPSFHQAKQWLNSGKIGQLSHVRSYAGYSAKDHNREWVHDPAVTGGGALRDIGIHLIDTTRFLIGEIQHGSGFSSNSVWKFGDCEDNGFLLMQNAEGVIVSLHASWTEWKGYRFSIELYGENGCIRASCFPMFAELVQNGRNGGKRNRVANYFPQSNLMEHLKSYRWIVIDSFVRELEAFVHAIRNQPSDIASGFDGLRAVEIAGLSKRTAS